jgi:hypothetical protein
MKATRLRHSPARRRRRRLGCTTSGRWAKSFVKSWNEFDGVTSSQTVLQAATGD